jgi:hypothetical protein
VLCALFRQKPNSVKNSKLIFGDMRWTPLFGPVNAEIKLDFQALLY